MSAPDPMSARASRVRWATVLAASASVAATPAPSLAVSVQEALLRAVPAVALVSAEVRASATVNCGQGPITVSPKPFIEVGTGWFVDGRGYLITNAHVVDPAYRVPPWVEFNLKLRAVEEGCVYPALSARGLARGQRPDLEEELLRAIPLSAVTLTPTARVSVRLSNGAKNTLDALPTAVARFMRTHENVKFDLQTIHHDDLLRKLYERETDVAVAYQVPPATPIGNRWLGEGELVLLYREEEMPDAPPSVDLKVLNGRRFISLAASGPIGGVFSQELQRLELELDVDEVVSARTFYIACALVRQGVGMAVVDSFTAQASLTPGLSMRPLKPRLTFDVQAMYLINRPPNALAAEFLKTLAAVIDAL